MYLVQIEYSCEFDGYYIDVCLCNTIEEVLEVREVLEPLLSSKFNVISKQMDTFVSTRKFKHKIKQIAKGR